MNHLLTEDYRNLLMSSYFKQHGLIHHQISSFNWFINKGLKTIINNESCIKHGDYTLRFNNIYTERPNIYPHEARDGNLSYTGTVYVDVVEITKCEGKTPKILEHYRVPIAKIPIMVLSDTCNLRYHSSEENECNHGHPDDNQGGFFIINGKERVLVSQVRKAYNKPLCYVKSNSPKEDILICEMRSMCDETFHSNCVQIKSVKNRLVISLKLKKKIVDVPVGVVFKSLGYLEHTFPDLLNLSKDLDKYLQILQHDCSEEFDITDDSDFDEEDGDEENIVKVFRNMSISADKTCIKDTITIEDVKKCLDMDLFPHLGITATKKQRAQLLAFMVKKYLYTLTNKIPLDSKDDYCNKRVETAGELCYFLFRLLYKKFFITCHSQMKNRLPDVLNFLRTSGITTGMNYSFSSGSWGVQRNSYIRTGVSQVVNPKVSTISNYSSLRRIVIPERKDGKEANTSELRQIHPSSAFFICPVETPEGKGIGTVLNMALFTSITVGISTCEIIDLINTQNQLCNKKRPCNQQKCFLILINGTPYGYGHENVCRLNFINDINISIVVNYNLNVIEIFSDSGRLIRPVFDLGNIYKFKGKIEPIFDFYISNRLIRYMDNSEIVSANIAIEPNDIVSNPNTKYEYMELHPVGLLGIVAATIPLADRTQSARNCFYSSMIKQAIGYIPGHHLKTETVSHVLNYPQKPLVTTDVAEMNGLNNHPNGINAIVAIACYTGYNQEDSIILNKASIERGLFITTTFNTFTLQEKKNGMVEERIEIPPDNIKTRDCNYGLLQANGIVKLRQQVKKGDVLIGKVTIETRNEQEKLIDNSIVVQDGEFGYVDRIVDTVVDGCRLVKVVIAQTRTPEIGDKFCSGMAQKGTCGMVFSQEDMPFTSDGMTPDIIINPNCIPSRMTINQIIATIMGKLHTLSPDPKFKKGNSFMNTPFLLNDLCDELKDHGYSRTGAEIMYCGFTGEQIKSQIFIGPTYYHRLKHMVQDKIHARSHGQVTTLHRQPNSGRARGGGLRFGDMEKDCIVVHGCTKFLNERMFLYSDPFKADVCSKCGMLSNTKERCQCGSLQVRQCNMPYAFKNLLQELNGMGIKTKIGLDF